MSKARNKRRGIELERANKRTELMGKENREGKERERERETMEGGRKKKRE